MKNTLEAYAQELLLSNDRLLLSSPSIIDTGVNEGTPKSISVEKEETGKKDNTLLSVMELPVNNFLKTLKEIEAEFHLVFNSIKTVIIEIPDTLDTFGRLMKKTENSLPLSAISMEIPEYLEENY
jgi:hypothetical protein